MLVSVKDFWINKWRGTVSNALLISMAAISVMGAGFCWLKPSMMFCFSFVWSMLVKWCGLKLFCVGERRMCGFMFLRANLSIIFDEL